MSEPDEARAPRLRQGRVAEDDRLRGRMRERREARCDVGARAERRHDVVLAQQEHVGVKRADPRERLGLEARAGRGETVPFGRARPAAAVSREDVDAPRLRIEGAPDGVAEHLRVRVAVQHGHVRGGGIPDDAFAARRPGRPRMHGGGKLFARCGESGRSDAGSCRRRRAARISAATRAPSSRTPSPCRGVRSAARHDERRRIRRSRAARCLTAMAVERSGCDRRQQADEDGRQDACAQARRDEAAAAPPRECRHPAGPSAHADPPARSLDEVVAERGHGERDQQR